MQTLVNPYADKIVKPDWDYPPGWQMTSWQEQLDVLQGFYPKLNPAGLAEQAKYYLGQAQLGQQTFLCELTGQDVRLWDGLLVFPLPGRFAHKMNFGNLWADVERSRIGQGLWGKLCEEVLFPQLASKFPGFINYQAGEMGSDRFLPIKPVTSWLQKLEERTEGDFACRPFNFGRRLAGHAVLSSRWIAENKLSGIVTPTWLNGQGLLTSPDRLPDYGHLWPDCAGDRYRFKGTHGFRRAPYFIHASGVRLVFAAHHNVDIPRDDRGAGVVLR